MAAIVLNESLVNRLEALARSEGLTLEAYLERWAAQRMPENLGRAELSGEELERLLDAETACNATYRGSYPRADIYRDHD
jgi:hypothetical protein